MAVKQERAMTPHNVRHVHMIYSETPPRAHDIARHYDEVHEYYLRIWGEHMHHGLWVSGNETTKRAARHLIEVLARRTKIVQGKRVCDVGCGYGGTSRFLVEAYGAEVLGLTLSKSQIEYAQWAGSDNGNPRYLLEDWLHNDLEDASFDVVLAIESTEHMDKAAFFREAWRVLRPGGRIGVCTWLVKGNPRQWEVNHILEPICRDRRLPSLASAPDIMHFMRDAGFRRRRPELFSKQVRKTWAVCAGRIARLALTDRDALRFVLANPDNRAFIRTSLRMLLAYYVGSVYYGLFTARKPAESAIPEATQLPTV